MEKLEKFANRGYYVNENVFIYYTSDMDKTLKWFEKILGWYGKIIDRDENGRGTYGFVSDLPQEIIFAGTVPFRGIHLWPGEPVQKTLALIQVKGVRAMAEYIRKNGWDGIGDIHRTGASPETCDVTTIDGSVLSFFES